MGSRNGRWLVVLCLGAAACFSTALPRTLRAAPAALQVPIGAGAPANLPGLHNVFHLSRKLFSGSVPEGEAGFRTLQRLGVRTVLSVDGMPPDTRTAKRFGMRYVHLPFGYDGCPTPTADRIVRAAREFPGPIYVHCHHGKHRGPTAAALARIGLDGIGPEEAVRELRRAGTGEGYVGLYAGVRGYRPDPERLRAAPADFPETAPLPSIVKTMVAMDVRHDRLDQAWKGGWVAGSPEHAPAHEALQLRELLTELQRAEAYGGRPEAFRRRLAECRDAAARLESALRARNADDASRQLGRVTAACGACHATYRDVPQP